MCVAFFRIPASPAEPFLLASNRDEFFARPSAPAAEWSDAPGIYGGRDLKEGGTWLAVGRDGRFGLITNYRDPKLHTEGRRSRGEIIARYLRGSAGAEEFLEGLAREAGAYNPFNLVLGELPERVWFFSSRETRAERLAPGVHGVSNGDLRSRWPKVVEGKRRFETLAARDATDRELFALMEDRGLAPEKDLPSTGVPRDIERALSAIFIRMPGYGTRCSTLARAVPGGPVVLRERTYAEDGSVAGEVSLRTGPAGTPPALS